MLAYRGLIEPHTGLLQQPASGQLVYKVMSVENFLASIAGRYLHFNRVDSYRDFAGSDVHDGEQLPTDRPSNVLAAFANTPAFTAADYYDQFRSRCYAFCAALDDTDHLWTYGQGTRRGSIGIVFDFDNLRATLNRTLQSDGVVVEYDGVNCHQIFDVNYGIVQYVDWEDHRANSTQLPNPIIYTYLKDRTLFSDERELRICLSTFGLGKFVLGDRTEIRFPEHLHFGFDFSGAFVDGTIQAITAGPRCDAAFLRSELRKHRIELSALDLLG